MSTLLESLIRNCAGLDQLHRLEQAARERHSRAFTACDAAQRMMLPKPAIMLAVRIEARRWYTFTLISDEIRYRESLLP